MRRAKVIVVRSEGRPDEAAYGLAYDDTTTGVGFGNSLEPWTAEMDLELRRGFTSRKLGKLEADLRATMKAKRRRDKYGK
jgi:hypothetical protein